MTFKVIDGGKEEPAKKETIPLTKEELAEKRKEDNERVKRNYRLRPKG